jgi:hypothetical protein
MGTKVISGRGGKMARFFAAANEFCAEDWDIEEVGDEFDTTSTCSGGDEEWDVGNTRLEGNVNYTWDVTANPFASPFSLTVGSKHLNTKLYVHATAGAGLQDGPFWSFTMRVTRHRNSNAIKGKFTGTISFKSTGSYTVPTGNDSSGA